MTQAELKTYQTTGMNYAAIELMLELIREHGLTPDNVERIVVDFSSQRANHAAGHAPAPFTSRWAAVSSGPFQLAIALLDGDIDPARLDAYYDPAIAAVAKRIEVRLVDAAMQGYAALHITTTDGRLLEAERERYRADPKERAVWLRRHVGRRSFPLDKFARIEETIDKLETLSHISELTALLRPEKPR